MTNYVIKTVSVLQLSLEWKLYVLRNEANIRSTQHVFTIAQVQPSLIYRLVFLRQNPQEQNIFDKKSCQEQLSWTIEAE